jgi:hypothetical protein
VKQFTTRLVEGCAGKTCGFKTCGNSFLIICILSFKSRGLTIPAMIRHSKCYGPRATQGIRIGFDVNTDTGKDFCRTLIGDPHGRSGKVKGKRRFLDE